MCVCMYVCMCAMYVCMCVYVCMYVSVCVCVCIYVQTSKASIAGYTYFVELFRLNL